MPWMTRKQVRSQPVQSYTERELQRLLAAFDQRMQRLNDEYLRRMGEHIRDIGTLWPSDVHRLQQIRRMNRNLRQIERRIAAAAEKGEREIAEVFQRIAQEDARMATKILGVPDIRNVKENLPLQRILQAQARETANRMRNLSNTTVVSSFYRSAIDEACTAVQSGVEDYNTAIRRVVREAGQHGLRITEEGVRKVDYESGWSRRLDSAARMNVLDGVRHLNQSIMEEVGRQFGADGVEIDAHMLCAEDHLPYQGQQFSNEEFEEIQDSLPRPFGEWNCRHSWHPIMLGISPHAWTPEQLEEMRRFSTEPITVDGRTKTRYQWSQEMRRIETAVRQQKDTATLAMASGDGVLRRRCQGAIQELNRYYEELAGKVGMGPEFQRTYVAGFRNTRLKQTGGKDTSIWDRIDRRDKQAAKEYDKIRDRDDIAAVARSSGMSESDIQTIKNHIFFDEHRLYDGVGRLDPDYDMAVAWNRLAHGKPEERDFLLLKHELLESQVELWYNLTIADAHARANKKYDWAGRLTELLGEEGEPDGLL